jgi:hypothetical protein
MSVTNTGNTITSYIGLIMDMQSICFFLLVGKITKKICEAILLEIQAMLLFTSGTGSVTV